MNRIFAAIRKEVLILVRDRVGLAVLFIMPMILIFVMTLIQDSAFKTLNEKGIPVIFVDQDKDSLGISIYKGLKSSELCSVYDSIDGKPATIETARQAVADGKYLIGIAIPAGATNAIKKNVSTLVQQTLNIDSAASFSTDSVSIQIFIDPITKKSFIVSVTSSLREFISAIKTQIMFKAFADEIAEILPEKKRSTENAYQQTNIIKYNEEYASKSIGEIVPNAVQHNVPAWTIFAMFFIVLPLAGSMVKEKNEGSFLRLQTMPSSFLLFLNGKIMTYVIVCMIQFVLMLSVGFLFLPMMGMPVLDIGNSIVGLIIISFSTAFAATGFGIMMGTISKTEQQGAIMGALSILLLSAIGGIWVPTYVMPQTMRNLSMFSPLNWSLEGFYELMLRGGNYTSVLLNSFKLLMFFLFTMSIASVVNRLKKNI